MVELLSTAGSLPQKKCSFYDIKQALKKGRCICWQEPGSVCSVLTILSRLPEVCTMRSVVYDL